MTCENKIISCFGLDEAETKKLLDDLELNVDNMKSSEEFDFVQFLAYVVFADEVRLELDRVRRLNEERALIAGSCFQPTNGRRLPRSV
jgi:uncharacterized Rmd1/YagE family protein